MANIEKWQPAPLQRGNSHSIYLNVNGEDITKKITLDQNLDNKFLLFHHRDQMYGISARKISKLFFDSDIFPVLSPLPLIYGSLITTSNTQIPVLNINRHQTDVVKAVQDDKVILCTHIRQDHRIILGGIHTSSLGTFFDLSDEIYEAGFFLDKAQLNDYWQYNYFEPPAIAERFISGGIQIDDSVIYLLDFTNTLNCVEFQELQVQHEILEGY